MAIGRKKRIITDGQLIERTIYWSKLLQVSDWFISVGICSAEEMGKGVNGTNEISFPTNECVIRLVNPSEYSDWGNYDMELVLVHELLHLVINPHTGKVSDSYEERAINQIARALVDVEIKKEKGERKRVKNRNQKNK